jgi:O-antigen/teichoic acid export membrane protein
VSASGDGGFRPTFVLMTGRALAFLATFFIPVVLVRLLDQATFGTYRQIFLIHATLYPIGQFGMADSLFYFLPGAGKKGGAFVANALLFLLAAATAAALGLWAAAPRIAAWLSNAGLSGYMGLASLFIGLTLLSTPLEMVMIARKGHRLAAWTYGLSDVVRAASLMGAAALFGGLRAVLVGALVFATCRVAALAVYVQQTFGEALRPDRECLRAQLAYSVPFGIAVILEIAQTTFHQYAVSHYFDAAAFAVYSVGCLNLPLVDFIVGPAGNVMMVRMRDAIAAGRPEAVLAIWHDTTRKLALAVVPLVGLSLVTAPALIVFLFTARYAASARIFMIWSTGFLWSALMTDGLLRVHADMHYVMKVNAVKLGANVLLMSAFIFTFGLPGAVLVTLMTTAAGKMAALYRARGLMGVSLARLLPWRGLGMVGAAAVLAAVPALLVPASLAPVVVLLARGTAYAGTYLLLVLAFGALSDTERRYLRGITWASPPAPAG